ncbi:unnamed protein product, partial [Musa banksii]
MARLLIFVLGDRSYGADSTSHMTGILFMLGLVAATISIMAVVIFNCGDSNEPTPKRRAAGAAAAASLAAANAANASNAATAAANAAAAAAVVPAAPCGGGGGGYSKTTTYTLLCFFVLNQSPSCSRVQLMKAK